MRISDWSSDVCSSDLNGAITLGYGNPCAFRKVANSAIRAASTILSHTPQIKKAPTSARNPSRKIFSKAPSFLRFGMPAMSDSPKFMGSELSSQLFWDQALPEYGLDRKSKRLNSSH